MNLELAAVYRAMNRRIRGLQASARTGKYSGYDDKTWLARLAEAKFLRDCVRREIGEARKKAGVRE